MPAKTASEKYRKRRAKEGFVRVEVILPPEEASMLTRARTLLGKDGKPVSQQTVMVRALRECFGHLVKG